MARHCESVCRLCRREGIKLFLKGDRCLTDKCAIERRAYGPGQHGQARRRKQTEYGLQLREKQKLKRLYGLLEKPFRITFARADRKKGITGENLLRLLECRLDNATYRCGIGRSRKEARQMVRHGHVSINGGVVTIPSYQVKAGDQISVNENSAKHGGILESVEGAARRGVQPEWLEFDAKTMKGQIVRLPERSDMVMPINEQLVVELYSK